MLTKLYHETFENLRYAITWNNEDLFDKVLKAKVDINKPLFNSTTPLEFSISKGINKFVFKLLENKAQVNIFADNIYHPQKRVTLLRTALELDNLSAAKLLVLYGARIQKDTFEVHPKSSFTTAILNQTSTKLILEKYKKYHNIIQELLQQQPSSKAYLQLSKVWKKISEEETDKDLKICYEKKSTFYMSESLLVAKEGSSISQQNIFSSSTNILTPLLSSQQSSQENEYKEDISSNHSSYKLD